MMEHSSQELPVERVPNGPCFSILLWGIFDHSMLCFCLAEKEYHESQGRQLVWVLEILLFYGSCGLNPKSAYEKWALYQGKHQLTA